MIKHLLNLNKSTRIITILLATLLLLPQSVMAEDQAFKDNLGGTWFTDGSEITNNSFNISAGGKLDIVSNSKGYQKEDGQSGYYTLKSIKLNIDESYTSDQIHIGLSQTNTGEAYTEIGDLSQYGKTFYLSLWNEYYPNGITLGQNQQIKLSIINYSGTDMPITISNIEISEEEIPFYNIRIAGTEVSSINSNDILNDGGKVSYNYESHTLTLNNANIILGDPAGGTVMPMEAPGIDYMEAEDLTIKLIGTNKIISSGGCDVIQSLDTKPEIIFKKGDDDPCSLELEGGSGCIISGFSNISGLSNVGGYGNDLVLVYDKDVYYTQDEGLYYNGIDGAGAGTTSNPVTNATIATDYHVRIGNVYVTNLNCNNILNDEKVSYSAQTNTLMLNGATIQQPLTIEQNNLTINLEGTNSIAIEEEESSAIIAEKCSLTIKSTSKTGSLTLSSSGGCPLTQGITPTIIYPLVSSADINNEQATKATIHPVYPPIFSNTSKTETGINVYIDKDEENGGAGTIKYSIEYTDKSTGVTNQEFVSATGISMNKPGILTAWIELDSENKSADIIGKFFGYKQKTIRKVFNGTDAVTFEPEIIPEIEENDNIIVSYETASDNVTISENVISMSGLGSSMIAASLEQHISDIQHTYKLNPDTIHIKLMAIPAKPSIPEDNSSFLDTDKITITSTAPSGTTICYKWDNGTDKTYSDKIAIEGTTLSAWVKYQPDADPVYSDTISATYTIKTDIEGLVFTPATITDIPYTSHFITPSITIKTQDGTPLTTSDYTLSYMKVTGNDTTVVESAINAGSYILTIEGKGSYGGKKEMPFNIVKATADWTSNGWTAPVAKSELKYTGETMDLITAGITPEGTTMKYLTIFNPENNDYVEGANEEWTATIPTGTAVGDYAVFYKVEGGDNYNDWGPSEVGIMATIGMGEASISAENITATYTGEPIGFDKEKVEISIPTISKDGIGFKYFKPNPENPEEPIAIEEEPADVGTYNVFIYLEDANYAAESVSATLTITAKALNNSMVSLSEENLEFNGSLQIPNITVNDLINGENVTLKGNTNYTISYQKVVGETTTIITSPTNAGNYNVVVTGIGNYTSSVSKAFTITSKTVTGATVTLDSETSIVYDGTEKHPAVTKVAIAADETTGAPEKVFSSETDYDVSYSNGCTNVGDYTVIVTFKGNYTGTATATFTITRATIAPKVSIEGWTYGATGNEPSVTGNSGSGEVTYTYKLQNAAEEAYSATKPTNAGDYTIKASIAATANYESATDSAHFTIRKAAGELSYSTVSASAELNGDGWTAPKLSNPNNLTVTYTSSNTDVAKISETGVVTLVGAGETTIKAASEGDTNHEACEAQYVLTVSQGKTQGYGVWVGETEVDEDNCEDILNDGEKDNDGEYTKIPSFIFNPDENTLLIINSDAGLTIESRIPELKIHLSNDNKLKKIFYNNQGKSENTGTLLFTCDSNFPGSVTIGNTVGESAISGFTSVSYEFSLQALKPAKAKYTNGQMTDSLGAVADTITVGTPLKPIQNDDKEELNADDFTVTNPDGSTATLDLTSANVNDIYYTLPESTEGQGYDPETNTINVIDPMTDDAVDQIAAATTNKNTTVGSSDYAENFIGVTFIVQGGEGVIRIDQETEEGYEFHLKIGDKPSIALKSGKEEITYSLPDATYCWLYLVRNAALARGGTRVNKRDHTPGNIRLIKVQSKTVASTKSAKAASGGAISPKANNAITGIVDINKDTPESKYNVETVNDKWYTIDGRRIDKPTKKGLYIRNRKKVVVK